MGEQMEKIRFLNTWVNNFSMEECLDAIELKIATEERSYLVAVNADVILKIEHDKQLKDIADHADFVIVDGKPLIWIAKKQGIPIEEKISGSDLVPLLCERAAKKGYTIFILGGKDGVAAQAKKKMESVLPDIKIVGTYAPPINFENDNSEIERINNMITSVNPDILLVCLGCPKQEKFIYENFYNYTAKISICAGATVDFLAGNIKRAPKWMSDHGFEWLFRFFQEPRRLFKRYFIEDPKIFKLAKKYKPEKKK